MQTDMHYYGTYAMARAAGLSVSEARTIAYAAQYVDDSTSNASETHRDGGMFQTIATAHTNSETILNALVDQTEQRNVWVPFHFFPGNQGTTLSQRLACVEDGELAQEMTANHIQHAAKVKDDYGLALLGVMAHVYADTFSHYGFSGVSSRNNQVDGDSFELKVKDDGMRAYILNKYTAFLVKYMPRSITKNYREFVGEGSAAVTLGLGHGAVGTYPDRPFLKWRFNFKKDAQDSGWRDNPATFLNGCEKLHQRFCEYNAIANPGNTAEDFNRIKPVVENILCSEKDQQGRIKLWCNAINQGELFNNEANEALSYSKDDWEEQKTNFTKLQHSHEMIKQDVYKFHQAAIYHRDYTLKQLLPKHGLIVL